MLLKKPARQAQRVSQLCGIFPRFARNRAAAPSPSRLGCDLGHDLPSVQSLANEIRRYLNNKLRPLFDHTSQHYRGAAQSVSQQRSPAPATLWLPLIHLRDQEARAVIVPRRSVVVLPVPARAPARAPQRAGAPTPAQPGAGDPCLEIFGVAPIWAATRSTNEARCCTQCSAARPVKASTRRTPDPIPPSDTMRTSPIWPVTDVRSTAELGAKRGMFIPFNAHDPYLVAILFAKECERTLLDGGVVGSILVRTRSFSRTTSFTSRSTASSSSARYARAVCEVESEPFGCHQGSRLMRMLPKHFSKRCVKHVRAGVVSRCVVPARRDPHSPPPCSLSSATPAARRRYE